MTVPDFDALSQLFPEVYTQLHAIAENSLARERRNHSLQATALVHEAYLRLARQDNDRYRNRQHFLAIASTMIRRILIDHARRHQVRRPAGQTTIEFEDGQPSAAANLADLLVLDDALNELAVRSPRKARLVELRFFGGLSTQEAAEELSIAPRTASDDWLFARAWLRRRLQADE